jgi:hypothetical protein
MRFLIPGFLQPRKLLRRDVAKMSIWHKSYERTEIDCGGGWPAASNRGGFFMAMDGRYAGNAGAVSGNGLPPLQRA